VPIEDPAISKKIHSTWRLQYLKDVVLARILDDPTFSVLNSLIFFNQVDIVSHLQGNTPFLKDLFGIIDSPEADTKKRKDAICFIQQCCAIAKNLQAPARATLYSNFVQNGLLNVITYALAEREQSIRVAGTDILVAMIDHDPSMVRAYISGAIKEDKKPLTETLIELMLVEADLGVKAQAADAIKVLLDPQQSPPPQTNPEFLSKLRGAIPPNPQTETFIRTFYNDAAKKLFQPLKDLETKQSG
jgi:protein phosphatase-4 regulatory subunit 3